MGATQFGQGMPWRSPSCSVTHRWLTLVHHVLSAFPLIGPYLAGNTVRRPGQGVEPLRVDAFFATQADAPSAVVDGRRGPTHFAQQSRAAIQIADGKLRLDGILLECRPEHRRSIQLRCIHGCGRLPPAPPVCPPATSSAWPVLLWFCSPLPKTCPLVRNRREDRRPLAAIHEAISRVHLRRWVEAGTTAAQPGPPGSPELSPSGPLHRMAWAGMPD
jgi:hypothetical protein